MIADAPARSGRESGAVSRGRPVRRSFFRSRAWSWRSYSRACSRPTIGVSRPWSWFVGLRGRVHRQRLGHRVDPAPRPSRRATVRPCSGQTGDRTPARPRRHRCGRSAREVLRGGGGRPLFAVLSIGFFVAALGATHSALLVRAMRFRHLELRQIAATVVGAVTGIGLAWPASVHGRSSVSISRKPWCPPCCLWYLARWRPSLTFSIASVRRLGGFAGTVFAENILYQAGRNVGSLMIGRFLGAASVGAYLLATNVILVPFSRMAGPLQQVFFPAFSQMSDDRERMAAVWIRATRLIGMISVPALVGLVIVAPDFVQVVLGPKWHEVTPLIQILACAGIIQSLQTLSGEVLLALGRASTGFSASRRLVRRQRRCAHPRPSLGGHRGRRLAPSAQPCCRAGAHSHHGAGAWHPSLPILRRAVGHRAGHAALMAGSLSSPRRRLVAARARGARLALLVVAGAVV